MTADFSYPADGLLQSYIAPGDFLDWQVVPLPHPSPDAAELTIAIFFRMPGWVKMLLALRNLLVTPFGLNTGDAETLRPPMPEEIRNASYRGIFAVHAATADEVILGSDDRHLDFRISLLRSQTRDIVAFTTWVRPHNLLGRVYLALVYPFHRIIVARCLANVARLGITR